MSREREGVGEREEGKMRCGPNNKWQQDGKKRAYVRSKGYSPLYKQLKDVLIKLGSLFLIILEILAIINLDQINRAPPISYPSPHPMLDVLSYGI